MKLKYYPTFLIVGAAKSGTTSLYHYLKNNPQIHMSAIKEPWFFSIADLDIEDIKSFPKYVTYTPKDYESLFISSKDVKGEASPTYLYWYKPTIKNIKKYHPRWNKLKIIVILRNPAERAYSQYLHIKRKTLEKRAFYEVLKDIKKFEGKDTRKLEYYLDYFGPSRYVDSLRAYLKNFKNVKVYLYEDLKEKPTELMKDLLRFLEMPEEMKEVNEKYNVSKGDTSVLYTIIRKKKLYKLIPSAIRKSKVYKTKVKPLLNDIYYKRKLNINFKRMNRIYFKEEIKELERIINRDLSMWL